MPRSPTWCVATFPASDIDAARYPDLQPSSNVLLTTPQIIQFEDFHTTLAFPLLQKNRDVYPCFNGKAPFLNLPLAFAADTARII